MMININFENPALSDVFKLAMTLAFSKEVFVSYTAWDCTSEALDIIKRNALKQNRVVNIAVFDDLKEQAYELLATKVEEQEMYFTPPFFRTVRKSDESNQKAIQKLEDVLKECMEEAIANEKGNTDGTDVK